MSMVKKGILFGIGLVSHAEEKLSSFSDDMVKKGKIAQEEAKKGMDLAASRRKEEKIEKEEVKRMKEHMVEAGLVTREDLQRLEERIAALESRLEKIPPS